MIRTVKKLLSPLQSRVRLMIGRGTLSRVDDTKKEQEVQINLLEGEVHDHVERYQEYGFTSVPAGGAEVITVSVGGNRGHSVVIATGDRRYRLKNLGDGEVAIYDDLGQAVHLTRNGIVIKGQKITLQSPQITLESSSTQINGNLKVDGNIITTGNITGGGTIIDTAGNTNHHSHV